MSSPTVAARPPIDTNAARVASFPGAGQESDAPRAKALPLGIRPQAYALATENPLLYRDALHRIAHLAAFGPEGGRR